MGRLAEQGLAILMISSEMPEILGMSDRVGVMQGGTIRGVLTRNEATQDRILGLALDDGATAGSAR
jgi:ABC-type sugar transport system ATPase subunit